MQASGPELNLALTGGEARRLLSTARGEALLLSGTFRVGFRVVASGREHRLCVGDLELAASDGEP